MSGSEIKTGAMKHVELKGETLTQISRHFTHLIIDGYPYDVHFWTRMTDSGSFMNIENQ